MTKLTTLASCLVAILLAGGCREPAVASYQIPKERNAVQALPATSEPAAIVWQAPAHWSETPSAGREATFAVQSPDGRSAELAISSLPGQAGGLVANINRWRQQLGLPSAADRAIADSLSFIETSGGLFSVTSLIGEGDQGILGAILADHDATWFFKFTGSASLLEEEKPAFLSFISSVRFLDSASVALALPAGNPNPATLP
jgi:hypothetical protein